MMNAAVYGVNSTYGELIAALPGWGRRSIDSNVAGTLVENANERVRGELWGIDPALFTGAVGDLIPCDYNVMLQASMVELRRYEDDPESEQGAERQYVAVREAFQKYWNETNLVEQGLAPQMRRG